MALPPDESTIIKLEEDVKQKMQVPAVCDDITEKEGRIRYDMENVKGADGMNYMNQVLFQQHAMEGKEPVLVAFCDSECGYCRRITPALKRLAERSRGQLLVGVLDQGMEPGLFRQEQIEALPTLVLYRQGEVLGSIVGPDSGDSIDEFLDEALGTAEMV